MKRLMSIVLLTALASCSSINSHQKTELKEWQASNLEVQEKSPGAAAALNILPGIGDFYNGNVGLGIGNLLLWPLSIVWATTGGMTGAEEVNYYSTKTYVDKLEKNKKISQTNLDEALYTKTITQDEHMIAMKKINTMDLKDFKAPMSAMEVVPARMPSSKK